MKFKQFINEKFVNLFKPEEKEQYAQVVWDILQLSYKDIGGLKGSGFSSKEDMIKSINMWKLAKSEGKVVACLLWKESNGRKLVAFGYDKSPEGKVLLYKLFKDELKSDRAYGEISHGALAMAKRLLGDELYSHLIPSDKVGDVLKKDISPQDDYHYKRKIGDEEITKVMYGKPGQKIFTK